MPNTSINDDQTTDIEDTDFLQDWLERRYGFGFAQRVVDDIHARKAVPDCAPYEVSAYVVSNDNGENYTTRKAS